MTALGGSDGKVLHGQMRFTMNYLDPVIPSSAEGDKHHLGLRGWLADLRFVVVLV